MLFIKFPNVSIKIYNDKLKIIIYIENYIRNYNIIV